MDALPEHETGVCASQVMEPNRQANFTCYTPDAESLIASSVYAGKATGLGILI